MRQCMPLHSTDRQHLSSARNPLQDKRQSIPRTVYELRAQEKEAAADYVTCRDYAKIRVGVSPPL